jgi:hypothetical protein
MCCHFPECRPGSPFPESGEKLKCAIILLGHRPFRAERSVHYEWQSYFMEQLKYLEPILLFKKNIFAPKNCEKIGVS